MRIARTMSVLVALLSALPAGAADDSKLKEATRQVEQGAKTAGEKLNEAGKAAEPEVKGAWEHVEEGASSFGRGVKDFFTRLTGN